jgi:hypothetical protein
MANRAELLKKIQARKDEKVAAEKAKWAKMRHCADEGAAGVETSLTNLAEACAAQAEAFENLKENLDLVQAPKEASLKARTAAARNYAKSFKRIAEEAPEQLAEAISEAYHSLDEQAGALEQLADNLGVDLNATPAEEAFAQEGINEIDQAEEKGIPVGEEEPEIEKESAGSEWFVTDRDESGQPKVPEKIDVPRVANSGPGGQGFVTDRNNEGKPEAPKKVEIPQAQGEAQTSIKDASKKRALDGAKEPAAFVADIPQAQGKTEVGAGKAGHVRPMKQMTTPAKPAASAEEFVANIPQSQGMGQTPGNKAAAARKR